MSNTASTDAEGVMPMILVQWTEPGLDRWEDSVREDIGYEIPALFHTQAEAERFVVLMKGWFGGTHRLLRVTTQSSGIVNDPVVITARGEVIE